MIVIELEKFLEERDEFNIPGNDVEWVRMLARELAIGVHRGLWPLYFYTRRRDRKVYLDDENLKEFGIIRWNLEEWSQTIERLHGMAFIVNRIDQDYFTITRSAFDLLQETEPYNVFISYKRSESSAFALLVNGQLKEHSLVHSWTWRSKPAATGMPTWKSESSITSTSSSFWAKTRYAPA